MALGPVRRHHRFVGNSYSYVFGPTIALIVIGLLVLVLRWAFSSKKTSVVAAAAKSGSADEYGMLVPVASPASFIDGEMVYGLSYAPWLRQLVDDMNLAYVSSVRRLNRRQAYGVALRYFSLGNITFTDEVGTTIRDFKPAELSLDGGFSQKFSDRFSGGFSARHLSFG